MRIGEYAVGKWEINCETRFISQDPVGFAYGRWLSPTPSLPFRRGHACFHSMMLPVDFKRKVSSLSWNWYPDHCELVPFNSNDMQVEFKRRKILFVGDSLLFQLVDSIEYLSGHQVDALKSWLLVDYRTLMPMDGEIYDYCECILRNQNPVERRRDCSKYASRLNETDRDLCPPKPHHTMYHRELRSMGWTSLLKADKYDTFVFSVGHHWFKEDPLYQKYPVLVKNVMDWLKMNFNGTVIYITGMDFDI